MTFDFGIKEVIDGFAAGWKPECCPDAKAVATNDTVACSLCGAGIRVVAEPQPGGDFALRITGIVSDMNVLAVQR